MREPEAFTHWSHAVKTQGSEIFIHTHQQLVKILDVIGLEEGEVPGRLVIDRFQAAIFSLHVETSHASNGGGSGSQLAGWSADGYITCRGRQHLRGQEAGHPQASSCTSLSTQLQRPANLNQKRTL